MDAAIEFLSDLLYGPFFSIANAIWNACIAACTGLITTTPEAFSPDAWNYVRDQLYPWTIGIGVSMMNLFFLIGFCRAATNFKENITLELCIESLIRIVVLNILLQKGFDLIRMFFRVTSYMAGYVISIEDINLYTTEADWGSHLFWWVFGLGYFIVALVCGIIIILTLYGRYMKLYVSIVFFPLAMPTVLLGRGADASAYAWGKSFLSNVFEIVVIALVMSIAGMIIRGVSIFEGVSLAGFFDGGLQAINSLITIILMTGSVKGASSNLNKSFAL